MARFTPCYKCGWLTPIDMNKPIYTSLDKVQKDEEEQLCYNCFLNKYVEKDGENMKTIEEIAKVFQQQ